MKIKKLKNITPKIRVPRTLSPKSWKHEASGTQGNVTLFGVNIFSCGWKLTGKTARVQHPNHGHDFKFPVYSVDIDGRQKEFAAGQMNIRSGVFSCRNIRSILSYQQKCEKNCLRSLWQFFRVYPVYPASAHRQRVQIMDHITICNTKYSPSIEN